MYKPLTGFWKGKLTKLTEKGAMKASGVKVEKVEISKRLTVSPGVVVTSQFGYSARQQKVVEYQNRYQLEIWDYRVLEEKRGSLIFLLRFSGYSITESSGRDAASLRLADLRIDFE